MKVELKERELRLSKSAPGLRLAAFGAAGLGPPPSASELERLRATRADVLLLLGGLGESPAIAAESVKSLAGIGRLVLVVLGGRDSYRVAHDALESAGDAWVIDATTLRGIRIGKDVLMPWGGSEHGRYALDENHCGFGPGDVQEAASALGPSAQDERRWLVSWQALPAREQRRATADAHELGAELVHLSELLGVRGAVSAWPAGEANIVQPGPLAELRVPRAWGPPDERADGTAPPEGASVLKFDSEGPRIER